MEAEKLGKTVEEIERRKQEVRKIQRLVLELQKTGEVMVSNPDDSPKFQIVVTQSEVTEEMVSLSKIKISSEDIIYKPEEEKYRMTFSWDWTR